MYFYVGGAGRAKSKTFVSPSQHFSWVLYVNIYIVKFDHSGWQFFSLLEVSPQFYSGSKCPMVEDLVGTDFQWLVASREPMKRFWHKGSRRSREWKQRKAIIAYEFWRKSSNMFLENFLFAQKMNKKWEDFPIKALLLCDYLHILLLNCIVPTPQLKTNKEE